MQSARTGPATTSAVRRTVRLLNEHRITTCGAAMLVMCSGGVDSVVLAHLMRALPRGSQPSTIGLLWLDHGLRDTTRDEHAVTDLAAALGVELHCVRCAPGELALQARRDVSGVPGAARTWRYHVAETIAHDHGYSMIVTGHTADDQIETALHRMLSSSGSHGLAGMRVARPLGSAQLVRPLLTTTRDEVVAVAREAGLAWVEDPSNIDTRFRRNELRHRIIPALDAAYPGARHAIARTTQRAAAQVSVEQSLARALLRAHTRVEPASSPEVADTSVLDTRSIHDLEPAARHAVLAEWLRIAGAGRALSTRTLHAVDALIHQAAPTGVVAIGGARVRRDGYDLTFTPHTSLHRKEST